MGNHEYATSIGSGTLPHIQHGPAHNVPQGTYPVSSQRDSLRTRRGDGVIVLNPEDFSISIGLRNQAISIAGAATALPAVPLENRKALVIHNVGPGILYIGLSTVTTANGLPLAVSEKIAIDCQGTASVTMWGVSDSTSDVRILELA